MRYFEEIDDEAVDYLKEVFLKGCVLSHGTDDHSVLLRTKQTEVNGKFNDEPNKWDNGKKIAWDLGLMENVHVSEGSYFKVKITDKGLKVLEQAAKLVTMLKAWEKMGINSTYGAFGKKY